MSPVGIAEGSCWEREEKRVGREEGLKAEACGYGEWLLRSVAIAKEGGGAWCCVGVVLSSIQSPHPRFVRLRETLFCLGKRGRMLEFRWDAGGTGH